MLDVAVFSARIPGIMLAIVRTADTRGTKAWENQPIHGLAGAPVR